MSETSKPDQSGESLNERLHRELEELYHELRSIIPGDEVLFAFLLTVAFTERFRQLDDVDRWVYFATLMCSGVALVLLLAPSAFHRVRFRQHDLEMMLKVATAEMIAALVLISLAITGVVFLITDVMFARRWASTLLAGVMFGLTSLLWWAHPLYRRREATR
ncbi:MAG: DUF6328 family protein [Acidimicrobiia bacterium]